LPAAVRLPSLTAFTTERDVGSPRDADAIRFRFTVRVVHLDILPAEARTPPRRRLEAGAPR
jgi:hypothetical protein